VERREALEQLILKENIYDDKGSLKRGWTEVAGEKPAAAGSKSLDF
jgi:hypothetical protein